MTSTVSTEPDEKSDQQDLPVDPRNDDDYDTWDYSMEPIPGDQTWHATD